MENMLSKDEITAIVNGDHGNVFAVLGIHRNKGTKKVFIRAYQPFAESIDVIDRNGNILGKMEKIDEPLKIEKLFPL